MYAIRKELFVVGTLVLLTSACGTDGDFDKVWDPPSSGGSAPTTGGATGSGGAASGGASATGGESSGGTSTGGEASGGASETGGEPGSGGMSSGGSGSGGEPTGGADGAGGEGSGGEGTGGAEGSASCTDYCAAWFEKACNAAGGEMYAGQPECLSACALMAEGTAGDASGNTVQCRITHLGLAMQMDQMHCGHASQNSTGNCVD